MSFTQSDAMKTVAEVQVQNPILRGFHPDPSILRVGDDFYIATSTFQWMPGVTVHHSRDLVDWRPLGGILRDASMLDLRGVEDSGGIFAPHLSHDGNEYFLAYTLVQEAERTWPDKTLANYVIRAKSLHGPWSRPTFLNSVGFDPSIYHAPDGSKWLLQVDLDPASSSSSHMKGIALTPLDAVSLQVVGPPRSIYKPVGERNAEGPHLYRRNGFFYLFLAEGGTGYNHQLTILRSSRVDGAYEPHPLNPILTSSRDPDHPLQKAGHASYVEAQDGTGYIAYLCSRPLRDQRFCPLGRETALEPIEWRDNWPYRLGAAKAPETTITLPPPSSLASPPPPLPFDLPVGWLSIREAPRSDWVTVVDASPEKYQFSLRGRNSLTSRWDLSLIATRICELNAKYEVDWEFSPSTSFHAAGPTLYYDSRNYFGWLVSLNEEGKPVLRLHHRHAAASQLPFAEYDLPAYSGALRLKLRLESHQALWEIVDPLGGSIISGHPVDLAWLSDESGPGWGFTGLVLGLFAQDLTDRERRATFQVRAGS